MRRAADGEDDFARAAIVHEQMELRGEETRLDGLHRAFQLACAGRNVLKAIGPLQTEAAVLASATRRAQDTDRLSGAIVEMKDDGPLLTRRQIGELNVRLLDFEQIFGRRGKVAVCRQAQQDEASEKERIGGESAKHRGPPGNAIISMKAMGDKRFSEGSAAEPNAQARKALVFLGKFIDLI